MTLMKNAFGLLYRKISRFLFVRQAKRFLFGESTFTSHYLEPVCRPRDRGAVVSEWSNERLCRRYVSAGMDKLPDKFVLYRIVGNDLIPRHQKGQSIANLSFILENEPELPACEKRFVVNRIVDRAVEEKIIKMLDNAGMPYIHIPFKREEYRLINWDSNSIPLKYAPFTKSFSRLDKRQQERLIMALYRHKNNYVMNNNGARNAALEEGKKRVKWVLPWDGNCFVSRRAWEDITRAVRKTPELPYFLVPMARVTDNMKLLEPGYRPEAEEEPQVIFRKDTTEVFNEAFCYGRRPKVELLWRLGVSGKWDEWGIEPWDQECPPYSEDAGAYGWAGWVARLFSGKINLERGNSILAERNRFMARTEGVIAFLDMLDDQVFTCSSGSKRHLKIFGFKPGSGMPDSDDNVAFHLWCRNRLKWLQNTRAGRKARSSDGYEGTSHDLQVASIALFLGEGQVFRKTLRGSCYRLLCQFDEQGRPREEFPEVVDTDAWFRNVECWVELARLGESAGLMLYAFNGKNGCGLEKVISRFLIDAKQFRLPLDKKRIESLCNAYSKCYGSPFSGDRDDYETDMKEFFPAVWRDS